MSRSSKLQTSLAAFRRRGAMRDARVVARAVLGLLLLANIIAAVLVLRPFGGSAEELEERLSGLRRQLQQRQGELMRLRSIVDKVEKARVAGDQFMAAHFTDERSAYSTLLEELGRASKEGGMRQREHSIGLEEIEGSELAMMSVTANYEGSYGDLVRFVNQIDRSSRFLIIESLRAAPQQSGGLAVNVKLNTFVRENR